MRVVILVPRRADRGRRDELWAYTKTWLTRHHPDYEIVTGDSPDGPFNRGAAINAAARDAGDWDLAIVHDGDNIVHPDSLTQAVNQAAETGIMHFAHDTYMYCDEQSSNLMLSTGMFFPRPQIYNVREGYTKFCLHKHISGVQVVPRPVWEKTGGFVELTGWGSEDSIFAVLCNAIGGGVRWGTGTAIHFWHEHAAADIDRDLVRRNRTLLMRLKGLERKGSVQGIRSLLASTGHTIP